VKLREYQERAISALRAEYARGKRAPCLVLPTGAGKTVIAAEIIRAAMARKNRVLFLVHRHELLGQSVAKLEQAGVTDLRIIRAGNDQGSPTAPVTVASIPTLTRWTSRQPAAELVIVDEAHHVVAKTWRKLANHYAASLILGLTATPQRADGKPLGDIFDSLVVGATVRELTDLGHLVPCRVFAPPLVLETAQLALSPVEAYIKHGEGQRAVIFCVTVEHAQRVADEMNAAGVPTGVVNGEMAKGDRRDVLARLNTGEIRAVSSIGVLTEGWDCLDSETEILTSRGWKGRGRVAVGDIVYSINKQTGQMEMVPVDRYVERPVNDGERMISIRSQHVNVRTTEGHEFHIKYRDPSTGGALSRNWLTVTGAKLVERRSSYALPLSAPPASPPIGVDLTDDELRLIAWFITDGGFEGGSFCISQSKHYRDEIRTLLTRLGLDFSERIRKPSNSGYKNGKPVHVFRIPKGTGRGNNKRNGWIGYAAYLDKNVSPLLHGMSVVQFDVFWSELLKGDGESVGKRGWLWCDRISQVNAYMEMALVRGLTATYSERVTKNKKTVYRISVRPAQWIVSDPADRRSARATLETPSPSEVVWCVTNRNSTIVTRRGGKVAIIGNCPAVAVCIMARKPQHAGLYLQMAGRVLRPAPGKTHATLIDLCGSVHDHGTPDMDRTYTLDGRGISKVDRDLIRQCPTCGGVFKAGPTACPLCGFTMPRREIDLPTSLGIGVVDLSTLPRLAPRAWTLSIQAKYPGTCRGCRGRIAVGDSIYWIKGEGARHADCEAARASA